MIYHDLPANFKMRKLDLNEAWQSSRTRRVNGNVTSNLRQTILDQAWHQHEASGTAAYILENHVNLSGGGPLRMRTSCPNAP